jgi:hypothetical protein
MSLCPRLSWFLPIVSETVPVWSYIPPNATLRKRIPRASNEGLPIRHTSIWGSGQGCPLLRTLTEHRSSMFSLEGGLEGLPLRVSNEGLPICYTSLKGSGQDCPSTARIGRAPFHRARSASKKDGLAAPSPLQARSHFLLKGWSGSIPHCAIGRTPPMLSQLLNETKGQGFASSCG